MLGVTISPGVAGVIATGVSLTAGVLVCGVNSSLAIVRVSNDEVNSSAPPLTLLTPATLAGAT